MSEYTDIVSIKLPANLAEIASKVGRAMDNDTGGADSFTLSEDGQTISTSALCTAEFKQQSDYLLQHPDELHTFLVNKYAERWSEFEPPTLAECELFCASVIND